MLNWVKFLSIFFVTLGLIITITVFYQANQPFSASRSAAANAVLKEGVLETVDHSDVFHGSVSLVSVYGMDKKGKEKVIVVDEKSGKIISKVTPDQGITKRQAADIVKKEDDKAEKILNTVLGLDGETLVWEVSYLRENDSLNYVYLNFTDGKRQKRIMNL